MLNSYSRIPFSAASLTQNWQLKETDINDEQIIHREPNEEILFCQNVANGELELIEQNCKEGHFYQMEEGVGILSKDPVLNLKYHFVITIALVTRFCCEAGMEKELGYRLSDFYILKLDDLTTLEEVIQLHDCAVMDFTKKMHLLRQDFTVTKPISEALDYIYFNIKNRLSINEVASALKLSESYLSRLFKKEVGISFSDYVREEKIKRAINLLRYSDFSLVEIAEYLGFSSQSHFTQIFKITVGMTPKAYRNQFYSKAWKNPAL
ncbi:MAG: AraC family transcriptional regulator [Lachnospiraceae bacterium]|nr:AraC family transcriptional regulator [Lachnospiraceae bacterium]